jgi:TetR/AcrR family transcriptional repressor of mexJK operon
MTPDTSRQAPLIAPDESRRRKRRPSPTSDALLEQAFDLFSDFGYDGTTIDTITDSIGVTKRTVYAKFGDKDALFQAALRHTIAKWIMSDDEMRACETDDLEGTLLALAGKLLDHLLNPRGLELLQMTTALALRSPELGAHNVQHGLKPTIAYLAELFERRIGGEIGMFQSARGAAMAFLNLTTGGLVNFIAWGVLLEKEFIDNYIAASVRLFLNGLLDSKGKDDLNALRKENTELKLLVADLMLAGRSASARPPTAAATAPLAKGSG